MPTGNYQNRRWFDEVTAKIKWCSFFTHMVCRCFVSFLTVNDLYCERRYCLSFRLSVTLVIRA